MARVEVPLKILASRSKSIVGAYRRLEKHYYASLALAGPPTSRRWEFHILIDRAGLLEDDGVTFAAGPVTLVKSSGLRDTVMRLGAKLGLRIYHPPWGTPVILVVDTRSLDPLELEELRRSGLERARRLLGEIVGTVEIVEK